MAATERSGTTRRSFVLSFAQRHIDLAIRLVGMVVLARLIPPAEFGVYVVAASVVGGIWLVAEFGLPQYLINSKRLDARERAMIFGVAILASGLGAAAIIGASLVAPAGWLGADMRNVLFVLGLTLLPQPLVTLYRAERQRDMRFEPLLVMNTVAVACGVAVAIACAAFGQGALSMAWGNLAEAGCLFVFAAAQGRPVPRPRFSLSGWRGILRFGRSASIIGALMKAGETAPPLVIGMFAGFAPAALFSRAWAVAGLFDRAVLQAVSPVILPLLAGKVRHGDGTHRQRLGDLYVIKISYLTALAWPFFAFLAIWAGPVVAVLLGPEWRDAVPVLQLLCIAGALLPFNQMNQKFFIALGLIDRYMRIQLVTQSAKILAVCVLAAISFELVALAIALEQAIKSVLTQRVLARELFYRKPVLYRAVLGSAAATAAVAATAGGIYLWANDAAAILALPAAAAVAALTWLGVIAASSHPLRREVGRAIAVPQRLLRRSS